MGYTYTGWDRKDVEVEVDGRWHAGERRSWDRAGDGTWSGMVSYSLEVGQTYLARFPAERIRLAGT